MITLTREEILKASQFIINSYEGKYGDVNWDDCAEVTVFCINHTDGFICKWRDYRVICFRGSHGDYDWQDNLTFNKQEMQFGDHCVNIHTGFKTQYFTVQGFIRDRINPFQERILVCGHSLGGALASICALDIATAMPISIVKCITWGSPRVGGRSWKWCFDAFVPDSLRFKYRNDGVTTVPPWWFNYAHVGNKVHLNPGGSLWQRITGFKDDHYPQRYFEAIKAR